MSLKGFSWAVVTATLACLAPLAVLSQGQPSGQDRDPVAIYSEAGADGEQIAKIRLLGREFEEAAKVRMQLRMNLLKEMRAMGMEAEPDQKAMLSKQDEINKVNSEMAMDHTRLMLKIRSVLNTEQKQRLVQLLQQRDKASAAPPGGPAGSAN